MTTRLRFLGTLAAAAIFLGGAVSGAPLPARAAALADDTLLQMLDTMGYAPTKLSKGYLVALKRDTWTVNIQVVLSPDNNKLGFNANLGLVDAPGNISAAQWMALLVSNGDIDPSFFYFDKTQGKLYLHRALDNRDVTPAFLRTQLETFANQVRSTSDLWKFTK
jgi:hypothetical protein